MKLRGGLNVPGKYFRVNLTIPLGVLKLDFQGGVLLESLGIVRVFLKPISIKPADIVIATVTQGVMTSGVAVKRVDGEWLYFWCNQATAEAILSALEANGIPTDKGRPRAARKFSLGHGPITLSQ